MNATSDSTSEAVLQEELALLLPAPGDPDLRDDRHLLRKEHLMREIKRQAVSVSAASAPRRRRRTYLALSGTLLALTGGAAIAATTMLGKAPASQHNLVRCYSAASLSANYSDTSAATTPGVAPTDISASVAAAVNACAGLWQAGVVQPGRVGAPSGQPDGSVPPLTACVLDDGEAAVLPGKSAQLCQDLGLARLAGRP
ncbi:hypothetical protein [Streptacidiphilus melanogenes]|uniref:hypothetical protein n=1 Tax=Streptacidiphilus melanogenes TaxID=411235 RepID=UPI0005A97828|nr:hypothetical protein [Streptacidiphilus melanogenes]